MIHVKTFSFFRSLPPTVTHSSVHRQSTMLMFSRLQFNGGVRPLGTLINDINKSMVIAFPLSSLLHSTYAPRTYVDSLFLGMWFKWVFRKLYLSQFSIKIPFTNWFEWCPNCLYFIRKVSITSMFRHNWIPFEYIWQGKPPVSSWLASFQIVR